MTPLEIACRHTDPNGINCGAEPGEKCVWLDASGKPEPMGDHLAHAERIEDAAFVTSLNEPGDSGGEVSKAEFGAAVDGSGLI